MSTSNPPSWPPRPLRKLAGCWLEKALNHALSLDPDTRHALAELDGRRVLLHLRGPELKLGIRVDGGHLRVESTDSHDPAQGRVLQVSTSPGSMLAMACPRDNDSLSPGQVDISGDADLARRLQKLGEGFAPDIEEALTKTFGELLGPPLASMLKLALGHIKDTAQHAFEDGAAWLRDEKRLTVAPAEMEDFLDDVDHLRERSERLEARLTRLLKQGEGSTA